MPTLVRDPQPAEFEAVLEQRRKLGQDLFDEVWAGVYHVNPAPSERHGDIAQQLAVLFDGPARAAGLVPILSPFNIGEAGDYRVPDGGLRRERADRLFLPTAALVVEIVSPDDETWEKLGFYAAHQVDELVIVDPEQRQIHWLGLTADGGYEPITRSGLIDLDAAALAGRLDWPA